MMYLTTFGLKTFPPIPQGLRELDDRGMRRVMRYTFQWGWQDQTVLYKGEYYYITPQMVIKRVGNLIQPLIFKGEDIYLVSEWLLKTDLKVMMLQFLSLDAAKSIRVLPNLNEYIKRVKIPLKFKLSGLDFRKLPLNHTYTFNKYVTHDPDWAYLRMRTFRSIMEVYKYKHNRPSVIQQNTVGTGNITSSTSFMSYVNTTAATGGY